MLTRTILPSFFFATLLLAAPASARQAAPAAPAAAARFDPMVFFTGRTEGAGRLKVTLRQSRAVDVRGEGRVTSDGTLVLRQTVEEHGKDPRRRVWRIREVAPGRYAGTLTDASGPVEGALVGGRLKLSYAMKGGFRAVQWIEGAADGRSARNRMTVSRLGIPVARLDETIRRVGL